MKFGEEILLLVKSRYSLIWIETIDEDYTVKNILESLSSNYKIYFWLQTKGIYIHQSNDVIYDSTDPIKAIKLIGDIASSLDKGVFILYDIDRYFDKPLVVRLLKDILSKITDNSITIIVISPNPLNIKDFDNYVVRITGALPSEDEIIKIINSEVSNYSKNTKIGINISKEEILRMINAFKGLTEKQIRNIILRCLVDDNTLDLNDIKKIEKVKKEIFDKGGFLEYFDGESVENIAGFDNLKKWVLDRKKFLDSKISGVDFPKGILICGIPGCGKSLSAKVISNILGYPLYRFDPSSLYSKYIGESEENTRKVFDTVEKISPIVLWIDEIEKIFVMDESSADGGVSRRIFSMFLVWMGERKDQTFIVATSNDVSKLLPEFIRKGRFDEIFFADLPDLNQREEIFKIHMRKRNIDYTPFNIKKFALNTEGFSGSEIEQVLINSIYASSMKITEDVIISEIKKITPLSILKKDEFTFIRNWAKERGLRPV
jgi:SpoVK/Ycf46/Vps4 family AAA+-type ATPase